MAMTKALRLIVTSALLALTACQHARAAAPEVLSIRLNSLSPGQCSVALGSQTFSYPSNETNLSKALKAEARTYTRARIDADYRIVPFHCFSGVIFLAQRAGFGNVGFVAEPPGSDG